MVNVREVVVKDAAGNQYQGRCAYCTDDPNQYRQTPYHGSPQTLYP